MVNVYENFVHKPPSIISKFYAVQFSVFCLPQNNCNVKDNYD